MTEVLTRDATCVIVGHVRAPIGHLIRQARQDARLSHDRLAEKTGTTRRHLIRLEQNVNRPRPGLLARIAEATGKPASFFDLDDEEESSMAAALLGVVRRLVREEMARVDFSAGWRETT